MSLLLIKKTFKKATAWCVQHWRWLVLLSAFLITYCLGGRKNRSLLLQANLAKKQYKKESEAIEAAHAQEIKDREKAHKKHDSSLEKIERTKEARSATLEERKLRFVREATDDDVQEWLDGKNFEEK
jgi:hypothetical protein